MESSALPQTMIFGYLSAPPAGLAAYPCIALRIHDVRHFLHESLIKAEPFQQIKPHLIPVRIQTVAQAESLRLPKIAL
ncbi:MAG: hypothetical protein ACYC6G_02185 [Desulfobaccales bacterium]